ncbi:hypothetical protein HW130_01400 [Streptomyces sp. PKU-EA00015]|nr:hypothetical protein [Streptomyces sp. PKU-EA00015]
MSWTLRTAGATGQERSSAFHATAIRSAHDSRAATGPRDRGPQPADSVCTSTQWAG